MRNALALALLCVLGFSIVGCSSIDAAGAPKTCDDPATRSAKDTTIAPRVAAAPGDGSQQARKRLRGFFLQVPGEQDSSLWKSSIDEIAALGADTVIIQTESYVNTAGKRNCVERLTLKAALEEAQLKNLKVHIGLALLEEGNGNREAAKKSEWIEALIAASTDSFNRLWDEYQPYAQSGTWAGVYLPEELWTPADPDDLGQLPMYVKQLSRLVKTQSNLKVSMSPFINSQANNDANATRTAFTKLFQPPTQSERAEVDVVMLQDGIGARGLGSADVAAQVPFYQAMKDACGTRCDVWANVESFADVSGQRVSAPWERVRTQIETLLPIAPNQVSFEYSQHWNAKGPARAGGKLLYDGFDAWRDRR